MPVGVFVCACVAQVHLDGPHRGYTPSNFATITSPTPWIRRKEIPDHKSSITQAQCHDQHNHHLINNSVNISARATTYRTVECGTSSPPSPHRLLPRALKESRVFLARSTAILYGIAVISSSTLSWSSCVTGTRTHVRLVMHLPPVVRLLRCSSWRDQQTGGRKQARPEKQSNHTRWCKRESCRNLPTTSCRY